VKTIFGIKGFALTEYAISANAVLGIRDSGKTYTATSAAEQLFDSGIPFVALDPIGVWRWLRVPGAGKGYPVVVAGGRAGDLPLTTKNAGAILRAAMESGVSLVIDLFAMELSKSDWRKIVRECVEILLHENADFGLRHVFIEEAAEFVPQRPQDMLVYSAVEKLVRMGGNSKLGCTLINQRSADLNKSVLELCANVFVHRQKGKNTLLDLKKWFTLLDLSDAEEKRVAESLPNLKSGECWALLNDVAKPVLLKVPAKNSLHPDRRAANATPAEIAKRQPVPADKFVAMMKTKLADKAPAPRSDKSMGQMLAAVNASGAKADRERAAALVAARNEGIEHGRQAALARVTEAREAARSAIDSVAAQIASDLCRALLPRFDALEKQIRGERVKPLTAADLRTEATKPGIVTNASPTVEITLKPLRQRAQASRGGDESLSGSQRQLLGALAWWARMGHDAPSRPQIAAIAGWKITGGHLGNVIGSLKTAGLVDYPNQGSVALTSAGTAAAPEPNASLTLHDGIRGVLSGSQRQIFECLLANGYALSREQIADACGWDSGGGHLGNVIGSLRTLEIVTYPSRGQVELQNWVTE